MFFHRRSGGHVARETVDGGEAQGASQSQPNLTDKERSRPAKANRLSKTAVLLEISIQYSGHVFKTQGV